MISLSRKLRDGVFGALVFITALNAAGTGYEVIKVRQLSQEAAEISKQLGTNANNQRTDQAEKTKRDEIQQSLGEVRIIRERLEKSHSPSDGSSFVNDILRNARRAIKLGHDTTARKGISDEERRVIERRIAQLEGIVLKW